MDGNLGVLGMKANLAGILLMAMQSQTSSFGRWNKPSGGGGGPGAKVFFSADVEGPD
jgi:hypothetical protein